MQYARLVTPTGLVEDRWLSALELRPAKIDTVHHVRIEIGDGRLAVNVDAEELANIKHEPRERQRFGFRGSFKPALINNASLNLGSRLIPTEAFTPIPKRESSISTVNFLISFFFINLLILLYSTEALIPSFFDKVGTEIEPSLVNS